MLDQLDPPSVVFNMVPELPTVQPVLESTKKISRKSWPLPPTSGGFTTDQLDPPSEVLIKVKVYVEDA